MTRGRFTESIVEEAAPALLGQVVQSGPVGGPAVIAANSGNGPTSAAGEFPWVPAVQ